MGWTKEYNDCIEMVWTDQTPDKHFWAFYYFCKKMGDDVLVETQPNGKKLLIVNLPR